MRYASNSSNKTAICAPETCTAYSSTSFEAAGLLLTALQHPEGDWADLDIRSMVIPRPNSSYPSLRFFGNNGGKLKRISDALTVPGIVNNRLWPHVQIFDQDPSILGWTCGNMVGATKDVAAWFYDLLCNETESPQIVSDDARTEMMRLEPLTAGWLKGHLKYGAGLMGSQVSPKAKPNEWGWFIGHEGQTFGFYSLNGYIPKAKAAFSIALNTDQPGFIGFSTGCKMMQYAVEALGETIDLGCGPLGDLSSTPVFV